MTAVKQNGNAIQFVPDHFKKDEELCNEDFKQNPKSIIFMS